jgi:hypothetical protein
MPLLDPPRANNVLEQFNCVIWPFATPRRPGRPFKTQMPL